MATMWPDHRGWLGVFLTFANEISKDVIKRFPAVGGLLAAVEQLDGEQSEQENVARLERLLDNSAELTSDMASLNKDSLLLAELAELLLEVTDQIASKHYDKSAVEGFAREAAMGAYRGRIALGFRYVDYRGLSLDASQAGTSLLLDQVFIKPRLLPESGGASARDREEELIRLLDSPNLDDADKENCLMELAQLREARWRPATLLPFTIDEMSVLLLRNRCLVILGGPGTGKSTFVRWLARSCVLGPARRRDAVGTEEVITPIVVRLAEYARRRRERQRLSIREFMREQARSDGGRAWVDALDTELDAGRVLVFLDGIDEEPDEQRRLAMVREVDRFLNATSSKCIVTSRPAGYVRLQSDALHVVLPNFDNEQVARFAEQWHRAYERSRHADAPDLEAAAQRASRLLNDIQTNPRVEQLAANPLMLVMMMLIREHSIRLPDRRVELYDRAVRLLLGAWTELRSELETGIEESEQLAMEDLLKALAQVAWWAHKDPSGLMPEVSLKRKLGQAIRDADPDTDSPELMAQSYLNAAAKTAGLLEERAAGIFAFWHLTFEEFLAAAFLTRDLTRTRERLLPVCDDPRWKEVVLLTIGHAGVVHRQEQTAGTLVEALLRDQPGPAEVLLHWRVRLTTACIIEDVRVPKATIEKLIGRLVEVVMHHPTLELMDSMEQMAEGVARQGLRLSRSLRSQLEVAIGSRDASVRSAACRMAASSVVNEESDDLSTWERLLHDTSVAVRFQAVVLMSRYRPCRVRLPEVLSSCCDGAPEWMSKREWANLARIEGAAGTLARVAIGEDPSANSAARLLSNLPSSDRVLSALEHALTSEDTIVVEQIVARLVDIGSTDDRAMSVLETQLGREDLTAAPLIALRLAQLGRHGEAVEAALNQGLKSDDWGVFHRSADALWNIGRSRYEIMAACDRIIGELASVSLSRGAIGFYYQFWIPGDGGGINDLMIDSLERALSSEELRVVSYAARALVNLSDQNERSAIAVTQTLERDNLRSASLLAAVLVARGRSNDAITAALERGVSSEDPQVLTEMIKSLPRLRPDHNAVVASGEWALTFDDLYSGVATMSASGLVALGRTGDAVVAALERGLLSDDPSVTTMSASGLVALGRTGDAVVAALERGLLSDDPSVTTESASGLVALGRTGDAVVAALERGLLSDDPSVTTESASGLVALGRTGDAVVAALKPGLSSEGSRPAAVRVVKLLVDRCDADEVGTRALERWLRSDDPAIASSAAARLVALGRSNEQVVEALGRAVCSSDLDASSFATSPLGELARSNEQAAAELERIVMFGDVKLANRAKGELQRVLRSSWSALVHLAKSLRPAEDSPLTQSNSPIWSEVSAGSWAALAELLRANSDDNSETHRRKRMLLWTLPSWVGGEQGWAPPDVSNR